MEDNDRLSKEDIKVLLHLLDQYIYWFNIDKAEGIAAHSHFDRPALTNANTETWTERRERVKKQLDHIKIVLINDYDDDGYRLQDETINKL